MRGILRRASDPGVAAACVIVGSVLPLALIVRPAPPLAGDRAETVEIRLVSNDSERVVLDVITGPIRRSKADAPALGHDRVALHGAGVNRMVGAPRVPVVGTLIGIPPGAEAEIEVIETHGGTVYQDVLLEPVARPFLDDGDGFGRPALRFEIDAELYARDADYPPDAAELGEKARLRDQDVVPLRLYPVRYNPVRGTLRHHARVRLGIRFLRPPGACAPTAARRPSSPEFDRILGRLLVNPPAAGAQPENAGAAQGLRPGLTWAALRAPDALRAGNGSGGAGSSGPRFKLGVEVDGFYRVSGTELRTAGLDLGSVDPRRLRLLDGGREVAIRILGEEDGRFDPHDSVEFFGRRRTTEFTRRNVYFLEETAAAGRRMAERDVAPSGRAPVRTTHFTTLHAEDGNSEYWQAMPDGEGLDHYFWRRLAAPAVASFEVTLPEVTSTAATADLRVALHGRTNPAQDPDHHTKVRVNGAAVDDRLWDGQVPFVHSTSFPQSLLRPGRNAVSVESIRDTGASVDTVYVNFIEVGYTSDLVAVDGALRFVGVASGAAEYRLGGFGDGAVELYDVTDPLGVVRCTGGRVSGPPEVRGLAFEDPAFEEEVSSPREYLAVAASAWHSPVSIELDVPSDLRSARHGADYLVISHADFLDSMAPLLELRAAQGLRTMAVDVTDVYDEFSFGVFDPTAIRDFIRHAYESWRPPAPTFVVLVGDANQDYLDYLGTGTPDFLPTHLFETAYYGQFPEDNFYAAVSGDDLLADVLIGRISVRTAPEADAVVAKILSYEAAAPGLPWNRDVLFVADREPGGFAAAQDALADSFLRAPVTASRVYLDRFANIAVARRALLDEIDQGAVLATYVGHGAVDNWARENLLVSAHVGSFANSGRYPFVTTLDCINGYYPHPSVPFSLAETLHNAGGIGAVAVWSPTGVGFLSEYVSISQELFKNLFTEGETQIGAATVDAVITAYVNSTASSDNLRNLVLFGDPATRLALNRDTDAVLDRDDNCPTVVNPPQGDADGDGVGDACDGDPAEVRG